MSIYEGYVLWCPVCGIKTASWICDTNALKVYKKFGYKDTFERQYINKSFPAHVEHGTITIVEEVRNIKNEDELNMKIAEIIKELAS